MATINVPGDYSSIQLAVNASSAGDTILVGPGTYVENVVIDKPLTLLSTDGPGTTTIQGDGTGPALGAVHVLPGVDNVTIGGAGAGFTVVGINGNGAVEKAAIYLQGSHDGILIQGNDVVANGDAGLLSEFGAAVTNTTIDGNVFSGQTFTGAQPDGDGFATQFNVGNNVPRQLVTMGNGGGGPYVSSNIVFTNNEVTGTAGGITSDDNVSEQGNTLVTIDAADSTISDNSFTGFTNRFATAVRARGPNTEVSDNSFDASASGSDNTLLLFIDNKGAPANYDGNEFIATDGTETIPVELTPGGDDIFVPGGGDDDIQGGGGFDTAVFSGLVADYAIVDMGGGVVVVTDQRPGSPEGMNTLRQFERFEFADGVVLAAGPTIDLDLNNSSGAVGNDFQGTFIEDGGPLLLNNGDIRVTDPDDTTLQSAVVELTNPLDGAGETLAINSALATALGIVATVAGDGHSITLTGAASLAAYQAVLGTVTYENVSAAPDTTDRRVTFKVSDGVSESPVANANIELMAVNQAPSLDLDLDDSTATGTAAAKVFESGGAPVAVTDSDVRIADADGTTLASATITLTDALDGAAEGLSLDLILAGNLGLAVAFGPDNQSITITGVADHVFYEVLLRTVTYDNGAPLPTLGDRAIEIFVNDGSNDSAVATSTISVIGNPLPMDDSVTVDEDSVANDLTASLLANDTDADADPLTIVGASGSANGAISVGSEGTLTYTPDADFEGTDSFTYTVSDGNGGLATAAATVTVTGVNEPPILNGGPVFSGNFDDGALNDGSNGFFDNGAGTAVASSGTNGVASLSGGFHATVGTSTPGAQGGAFTRWGGYEDVFPAGGYTTQMAFYLDVDAHAGNDVGFTYSNALNGPDGDYRTEFCFNVGTTGDPGDGFVVGASQRANDGVTPGVPAVPGDDYGPTANVTVSGWYTFQFQVTESGPGIRLDFTLLDAGGNVVGTWSEDRQDLVRGVEIGGNRYGWIFANEIPDLPVDNILKGEAAATPSVTYTEDNPPVVVNDAITVADVDDVNLEGASVAFVGGYVQGEDLLTFAGLGNISGSFDPATGILTLSGSDSVENYQAALRAVAYANLAGDNPTGGVRTVRFIANDGDDDSNAILSEIDVVPVNDAPLLDLDGDNSSGAADPDYLTTVAAGAGPVALNDGDILLSDADDTSLEGGTIALAAAPDGADEILTVDLGVAAGFGVTVTGNGTGAITLSGPASSEAYRQIFATAAYENLSALSATSGAREIVFTAEDGEDSASASVFVTVAASPALDLDFDDSTAAGVDSAVAFTEGGGAVVLNDGDIRITDVDGSTLESAAVVLTNPLDGADEGLTIDVALATSLGITAVVAADGHSIVLTGGASHGAYQAVLGTVRYDNAAVAPDTTDRAVTFTVNDGTADSNVATATIVVDAVNQAPVVDLDLDDSSAPGLDAAAAFVVNHGPVGILGPDVEISDVDGSVIASATVTLINPLDGAAEALSIDSVLAGNLGLSVVFGADNQSITLSGAANHLTYEIVLATVRYDNLAGEPSLADRIVEVTVNDGVSDSAVATGTISILPDLVAADDAISVVEDSGANDLTALLLDNDVDADGDNLTVVGASGAVNGSVDVAPDGTLTFTPADDFSGTDAFVYTVTDGNGGATASATVTVTVSPDFDDPVAGDDAIVVDEDSGASDVTALLLGNDGDVDGDGLTVVGASGAANGAVDVAPDGTVTFTPAGDFNGTDAFTYTVTDGNGGATASATVTVTVTPVADDPVAADDAVTVAEDSVANDLTAQLLANDGDVDGDALTIVGASGAANGTVDVAPDGTVTFTPDGDFVGTDSFVYTVTDGNGGATATATAAISVSPVDDAPALDLDFNDSTAAGSDFATTFTEGGAPVHLNDGDIRIADLDSGQMQSASVVLTNALDGAQESLAINMLLAASFGIAVTVAPDGHSIALTGSASPTQYQAVLGTVTYANGSIDPDVTGRTIEFTVNDGTANSNVAVATVAIDAVNQAPTLDLDGDNSTGSADPDSAVEYFEDGPAVLLTDGDIVIGDVDGPGIGSATVTIADALDVGETLSIDAILAGNLGVTVTVTGGGTGLDLQATGPISSSEWQQLLQTVSYDNGASDPSGTSRSVEFAINDGTSDSNIAVAQVAIIGVNDDPTAADDAITLAEDSGPLDVTPNLLVNDMDADGDSLTVIGASGVANGSVDVAPDGAVTYTSNDDFNGTDSFTYTITDGNGGATASAVATVTVTPVADAPVAADDVVSVVEDSGANDLTATLLANDSDADGDALTIVGASGAANGGLDVAPDGTVTFTPDADFAGTDAFTYTVTDGNGGETVSATASVTVTGANDDPAAADDAVSVVEDSGANDLTAALLANDDDPDGDGLTVVGVSGATNGSLDVAPDGTVSFTPDDDFNGTDTFTYTVTDGNGGATASATATITVTPAVDDPVAVDDSIVLAEDAGPTDVTATLLANDSDIDGDSLTVVAASGAGNGTVTVAPDGTVTLMPDADFAGTDAFSYTITDGNGGGTVTASATVMVTPAADDPTAADDMVAVGEDSSDNDLTAAILANDGDVDGDTLTVIGASGAVNGTVDVAPDGTVSFTPDGGFGGTDGFTYTVTDGNGGATASASVTVNVTDVNDDPVPGDDNVSVAEDSVAADLTAAILANDVDADAADGLTVVAADGAMNGVLAVGPDGAVTYSPVADYTGTDSFSYTITDGNGGATASATATITVTPVADDPVAADDTVAIDEDSMANDLTALVLGNDLDVDGDSLTIAGASGAGNGAISVEPDGSLLYTPDPGFIGTDAFTYTITDGNGGATASATVTVAVGPVNDDPTATDDSATVVEDTIANDLTAALLANDGDVDGDSLTIVGAADGGNGTVAVGGDGSLTYTPDEDFFGTDAFTYTITDGNGGATASATATVNVTSAGDDPEANDDGPLEVTENVPSTLNVALLENDVDPDGDTLTIIGASGAENGTLEFGPGDELIYTPDTDYTGTDSFTYTITDGNGGGTSSAVASISVVMGLELPIDWELFGSSIVAEGASASYTVQFTGPAVPPGESVSVEIGIDLPGGENGADASDIGATAFYEAIEAAIDALGPDSGISLVANRLVFEADAPTSITFDLPIVADQTTEGLEVFTVTLANPSSGEILSFQDLQATTILDTSQDAPEVLTLATFGAGAGEGATVTGTDGNDTILAMTADDIVWAGAGDDHISVDGQGFRAIAGGEGTDTVAILGDAVDINLSTDAPGTLTGIEVLDITGSGDNSIDLTYADLLEVADPLGTLTIRGDEGDRVSADLGEGGFAYAGVENGFHVYSNGTERLLVAEEITDQSITM